MTTSVKYTSSTLVMRKFISFLLGKEPVPDNWEDLHSEFIGLRENKSSSYVLSIMKDISYLQTKQFIITKSVEVLASHYSRDLVIELKNAGCKGKFDWSDAGGYSADLKAALSYSKRFTTQIKKKEKEIDDYYKRHGGEALQEKDFEVWAVTLSKFQGYRVSLDETTVVEWCMLMNQYEMYCEVVNAEENNKLKPKKNG